MSRSVQNDYDKLRNPGSAQINPKNAEIRCGVDGETVIVVTLTEDQKTLIFGEPVRQFSIRGEDV